MYAVKSTLTTTGQLAIGDPVAIDGTNFADPLYGLPYVQRAVAGSAVRGVLIGIGSNPRGGPYIQPTDLTQTSRKNVAQTVDFFAAVCDDPDLVFEIQELSSNSTPLGTYTSAGTAVVGAAAQMNKNANFVFATALPTNLQTSGVMLDSGTYATTATLNLKVLGNVQRLDNAPYTSWQRLLVTINNHDFSGGVAGV
jgi:hypothetical protein